MCGVTSSSRAIAQTRSRMRTTPTKCPSPQSAGKKKGDFASGLIEEQFDGGAPDHPGLGAALGVGKPDRPFLLVEPRAFSPGLPCA